MKPGAGEGSRSKEPSVRPKRLSAKKQERGGEALDKKSLSYCDRNGIISYCSALNTRFCPTIIFRKYGSILHLERSNERAEREAVSKWLSQTSQFESSLQTLLSLPYHKFWVIVDAEVSVHVALDSYLRNGARFYDLDAMAAIQTDQMKQLANSVHALVLKILIRMTTERESDRDFLTANALNSHLRRNLDLPKLMDVVSLYWPTVGQKSRQSICDIIGRVMDARTKRDKELADLVSGVMNLLHLMRDRLMLQADVPHAPPANHGSRDPSAQLKTMPWRQFQEIISTITDAFVSVACFMEAFPPSIPPFHELGFESACINFYDLVFPLLQQEFDRRLHHADATDMSRTGKQVVIGRTYAVHCCRLLILDSCLRPLLDPRLDDCVKPILCDSLLDVMTLILSNKYFAKDYNSKYPLSADIAELRNSAAVTGFSDVDADRIQYLLNECRSMELGAKAGADRIPDSSRTSQGADAGTAGASTVTAGVLNKRNRKGKKEKKGVPDEESEEKAASDSAGGGIQEVELLSLISGVKDILPDFGEGFIEACLEKFAFSQELTLNALLTDDLPDQLRTLDKNLSRQQKKDLTQEAIKEPDVVTSRSNVFDGDEFDIHRNERIDLSRIHIGKKDRTVQVTADPELRTRTLLMQQRILQEEEDEELALLAEMGITDPADLYVG